ncbi:MAG: DsbA family protein [Candidatus Latescibacteria bacterium]|jgi:putative protein-disulfide isomerase|nr:DsbA family protein [Candidatus Latescibacterota bacterium]MBT5829764.1 DsbA family protein [Candidatus Latescibacterota bacterium]
MKTLYYVADPMCSWCWGFQPILTQVKAALPNEVQLVYVMGGLARDSDEPMPEEIQAYVKGAWRQVTAETSASFNFDFWEVCQPRRSTYPSCRAFYAAKAQCEDSGVLMFEAIQRAYYQEARNPSDTETLIAVAGEIGLDVDRFEVDLKSEVIEKEMQDGFQLRRSLNANEFPSLVMQNENAVSFLVRGYDAADAVLERLKNALV